jgi:hypothetical protein
MIELDHVLVAVSDLEAAAREVERRHAQWVGDANLPISVREGSPALESVLVEEAVLDPALWA